MYKRIRNAYWGQGRAGTLVRAIVGSAGLRIAGMGLGFLVGVQLARMLGPAGYGIYGIAMSLIAIAMIPTELGLSQLVTREAAVAEASGDRSAIHALLRWSFKFVLVNSVGISLLILLAPYFYGSEMSPALKAALYWGAALLPLVAVGSIGSAALRGIHRVVLGQLAELIVRPGLFSLLLFLFWMIERQGRLTPAAAMMMNVVVAAIATGLVLQWVRPLLRPQVPSNAAYPTRTWLRSTIPLALGEGMRIVSGNVAILMLGLLATPNDAGLYRVAAGVYTAASLPSALLNVACSPMLARLHAEGDRAAIQRLNAWMALLLVVSSMGLLVPFVLVGDSILAFAFGASYASASSILLVLLFGELAAACLGHPTVLLNMMHREHAVTRFSLWSMILNVVISFFMIRVAGAIGAAIGMSVSQFAWRYLCSRFARRELGIETTLLAWRVT